MLCVFSYNQCQIKLVILEYQMMPERSMCPQDDTKTYFSLCVEENMPSLYALALRLTRNSADAEDLDRKSVV